MNTILLANIPTDSNIYISQDHSLYNQVWPLQLPRRVTISHEMGNKKDPNPKKGKGDSSSKDSTKNKESSKKETKAGAGTSVKVRHILCTKQSKALEAIAKLKEGQKFNVG